MNFGTVADGHSGHKMSKNSEWESFVTLKKFFECFDFDPKYLERVPLKNFCDFWLNQPSRVENTNMAENRNWK